MLGLIMEKAPYINKGLCYLCWHINCTDSLYTRKTIRIPGDYPYSYEALYLLQGFYFPGTETFIGVGDVSFLVSDTRDFLVLIL